MATASCASTSSNSSISSGGAGGRRSRCKFGGSKSRSGRTGPGRWPTRPDWSSGPPGPGGPLRRSRYRGLRAPEVAPATVAPPQSRSKSRGLPRWRSGIGCLLGCHCLRVYGHGPPRLRRAARAAAGSALAVDLGAQVLRELGRRRDVIGARPALLEQGHLFRQLRIAAVLHEVADDGQAPPLDGLLELFQLRDQLGVDLASGARSGPG